MNQAKRDFNQEAASWDTPLRIQLAQDIAGVIARQIPLQKNMDVLDFGCGTGLLSEVLHPKVHSITGVDASPGMLDVFKEKISKKAMANIKTAYLASEDKKTLPGFYHVIVSSMTLHHVEDIPSILSRFYQALHPGGFLAIADLDSEEGLFHANHDGVFHHGFSREALCRMYSEIGFKEVCVLEAGEIEKPIADGSLRRFSIFLITGQKDLS